MLVAELANLRAALPTDLYDDLSFFEITTLLAWRMFALKGCEFLVLEVGLGGRWDATNIADPLASAIVSIGLDHQAWLGSDVASIAREKAGVMRPVLRKTAQHNPK